MFHDNLKAYKLLVVFNFLYASMFKTYYNEIQNNLNFVVLKQRYKNTHRISSNKRRDSYKHRPQKSAAPWGIRIEIGASLRSLPSNKCCTYKCGAY